ncbi:uncharacterized protein [Haliotis asinina]|uniref:uncharacterized protein isoform X2 n=1 Tax=Haliotis asinina TaxID=109174 RepID=UPI0035323828
MGALHKMTLMFAMSYVQISSTTSTSLTLTREPLEAFPRMSLQFKCDVTTANIQIQSLIFQRNDRSMCTVKVDDCTQYMSATWFHTQYTCRCGQQGDGNYVYFLNASSLHNDVAGDWKCEFDGFSNIVRVNMTDPQGPTQIQLDKTELQVKEEESVNLTCSANCLPDCRYTWTKGGQDLTRQTKGSQGQVLALNGVLGDDSGKYTCTAVNPSSNKASNISVNLHVLTGPKRKLDAAFTPTLKTMTGQTARLEVTLSGDPRPDVSWWKIEEGSLTPVNGAVNTSHQDTPERAGDSVTAVLEVKVETTHDLGMYCVSAENIVERTFVFIDLQDGVEDGTWPALRIGEDMLNACHRIPKLLTFWPGVGVGAAAMLLLFIIVAVIFCRKYKELKRALESPYASTQMRVNAVMDSNLYQELPSPHTLRKRMQEEGYILPIGGGTAEVSATKTDMKSSDGTHLISTTNSIYDHIRDENIVSK